MQISRLGHSMDGYADGVEETRAGGVHVLHSIAPSFRGSVGEFRIQTSFAPLAAEASVISRVHRLQASISSSCRRRTMSDASVWTSDASSDHQKSASDSATPSDYSTSYYSVTETSRRSSGEQEKVKAQEVHDVLEQASIAIARTLDYSRSAQSNLTNLNLRLTDGLNAQYNELQEARTRIEERIARIETRVDLPPDAWARLLARYKNVKYKLEIRQSSLRSFLKTANFYFENENVGELSEALDTTHRRLLLLDNKLSHGGDLKVSLEAVVESLARIQVLPSYKEFTARSEDDTYAMELEKMERAETISDALRQIAYVIDLVQKAIDEPDLSMSATSVSVSSLIREDESRSL